MQGAIVQGFNIGGAEHDTDVAILIHTLGGSPVLRKAAVFVVLLEEELNCLRILVESLNRGRVIFRNASIPLRQSVHELTVICSPSE